MARSKGSDIWPYVLLGSAVGGAVGYLFMTQSGRKVRRALANPEEMADNIDEMRVFIERKADVVTGRVRRILERAKEGLEAGQRAFDEASVGYRTNMQRMEAKNNEVASSVHKTVDNLTRTAYTVEQSLLDPLNEGRAMYRGVERALRTILGRSGDVTRFRRSGTDRSY
jgi:hypothetical protein